MQKCYKVFWSKDVRKKKRIYNDGVAILTDNKVRLYGSESEVIVDTSIKNVYYHNPDNEDEFLINNSIIVLIDAVISKVDFTTGRVFLPRQSEERKKKPKKKEVEVEPESIYLDDDYHIEGFLAKCLRPHQVEGVKFMFECLMGKKGASISGCILADHMGLGKTLQALTLLYTLLNLKRKGFKKFKKAIVVSPLTLVNNWNSECKKWLEERLLPVVALGDGKQVKEHCKRFTSENYRLLLISYESFYSNIQILQGACDLLVFDEGHRLKNPKSKLYRKISKYSCKSRVLLTGTPLQNSIDEFHTCINLVNPMLFPSDSLFSNIFKLPILNGMKKNSTSEQRQLAYERSKELTERVKEFSLRRKADVLEKILPDKKEYHIFLKLTPLQQKLYEEVLTNEETTIKEPLLFIVHTRKLLTHPKLFGDSSTSTSIAKLEDSYKTVFAINVALLARQRKEKVIITSYFTQTLTLMQNFLEKAEVGYGRLDGSMSAANRHTAIEKFRCDASVTVFLLSAKAGGVGLNLTCANKLIMMEPDWNPSNDHQVMGRVWRDGQTKPVHIYRLIAVGTFEEKILQRQYMKQSLSEKLVDESKSNKLFDFVEMKDLQISVSPQCITYKPSENQVSEVRRWNEDFSHNNDVQFVYIRKSKNNVNGVNEFEDAELFLNEIESGEEAACDDEQDTLDDFGEEQPQPKQVKPIKVRRQPFEERKVVDPEPAEQSLAKLLPPPTTEDIVVHSANGKVAVVEPRRKLLKLLHKPRPPSTSEKPSDC